MRLIIILILSLQTGLLSPLPAGVVDYCPPAGSLPGWTFEFKPEVYSPDNLHEYINGEAELYKKYQFVEMATASYVHRRQPSLSFTVDIYDMGTALDAFGVYSLRRRPGMTFADIGEEATVSEMMLRFWKGRFYVQIVAGARDSLLAAIMQKAAKGVAASLPPAPLPPELDLLPAEHQVPHTLTFLRNVQRAGMNCPRLLEAQYKSTEDAWIAFILLFDDAAQAQEWMHANNNPQPDLLLTTKNSMIFGVRDFNDKRAAEYFLKHTATRRKQEP